MEDHDYPVTVRWISGHDCVAESRDGLPPLPLSAPPQFGGPGQAWTSEHLLVAAVGSCLMTTFLDIARRSRLEVLSFEAPAIGRLTERDDRLCFAGIAVRVRVTVGSARDRERAVRVLAKAKEACLITNALAAQVEVTPEIEVAMSASL